MTRTRGRLAIVAVLVLVVASVSGYVWLGREPAGPVSDPHFLQFQPSQDHDAVDKKGAPLVERYELEVYPTGATEPSQKIDLGKPKPGADGLIHVELSSIRIAPLAPGTTYEAAIASVGPYGRGASARSNRFTFTGR